MRIDIGIWSKKKIVIIDKNKKNEDMNDYESHWLRFERNMGSTGLLNDSSIGKFFLTDVDFLMKGSTYYDWGDKFEFRNV